MLLRAAAGRPSVRTNTTQTLSRSEREIYPVGVDVQARPIRGSILVWACVAEAWTPWDCLRTCGAETLNLRHRWCGFVGGWGVQKPQVGGSRVPHR